MVNNEGNIKNYKRMLLLLSFASPFYLTNLCMDVYIVKNYEGIMRLGEWSSLFDTHTGMIDNSSSCSNKMKVSVWRLVE